MNLCAILSILSAFIGFVGAFTMHNELHEAMQYTIKPFIGTIDQFTNEVRSKKIFRLRSIQTLML